MKTAGLHRLLPLLWIGILLVCVGCSTLKRGGDNVIRFGVIADVQYSNDATAGARYYRNSLEKLDTAVQAFNQAGVTFVVNLGDLVDRDTPRNLAPVLARQKALKMPCYNITGNHDYGNVSNAALLYKQLEMPAAYYAFSQGRWRFILLNTNELSAYAGDDSAYQALVQQAKDEKRGNAYEYNGGISAAQLQWLQGELQKAQRQSQQVIVFSHHPLAGAQGLTALNDKEIVSVLTKYPCVKAVISGHHHAGAFAEIDKLPFITTEGMVETRQNAYAIVELTASTLNLIGYGRAKSYSLSLRSSIPDPR